MPSESDPETPVPFSEKEIFLRALEIDDPEERCSWVSEACNSDKDLRTNVDYSGQIMGTPFYMAPESQSLITFRVDATP